VAFGLKNSKEGDQLYRKCGMSSWNLNDNKFLLHPHPLQVELRWTLKNGSPNPTIKNIHICVVH
jgi:hypothetical protein